MLDLVGNAIAVAGDAGLVVIAQVLARLADGFGHAAQFLGHIVHARTDIGLSLLTDLGHRPLGLLLGRGRRLGHLLAGLVGRFLRLVNRGRRCAYHFILMHIHGHTPRV